MNATKCSGGLWTLFWFACRVRVVGSVRCKAPRVSKRFNRAEQAWLKYLLEYFVLEYAVMLLMRLEY